MGGVRKGRGRVWIHGISLIDSCEPRILTTLTLIKREATYPHCTLVDAYETMRPFLSPLSPRPHRKSLVTKLERRGAKQCRFLLYRARFPLYCGRYTLARGHIFISKLCITLHWKWMGLESARGGRECMCLVSQARPTSLSCGSGSGLRDWHVLRLNTLTLYPKLLEGWR